MIQQNRIYFMVYLLVVVALVDDVVVVALDGLDDPHPRFHLRNIHSINLYLFNVQFFV